MLTEWFKNIEFAYGWVLSFLLLIPLLVYEYVRRIKRSEASMYVTTTHFISHLSSPRTRFRHTMFVLRCVTLVMFIIALARPQKKFAEQRVEGDAIDIVLCFDISGSMTEEDIAPNRLEAAKEVATQFVKDRPGDRIGIVIFSNQSFTLCPITVDHNTVIRQIQNVESGFLRDEGTAIGTGLATSVDRLRTSQAKSKIVVLLTDGVDFGGIIPPDIAKDMARLYKVKVYTIGVGSQKEVEEIVNTPAGPVPQRKKLEFNEQLLQDLAEQTGGQYFHAGDKDGLKNIYASINTLEKSHVKVSMLDRFTDEYYAILLIGLVILICEFVLRYTIFKKLP